MRQSGGCFTTFLGGQSLGVKSHRGMQTMAMQLGKPCQTLPCELVGGREIASCFFFQTMISEERVMLLQISNATNFNQKRQSNLDRKVVSLAAKWFFFNFFC